MHSIKRLIYIILVTCGAFAAYRFSCNSQSYWLIWSGLTLSLITLGDTFSSRLTIILAAGFAVAFFSFLAGLTAVSFPIVALFLFIITTSSVYLGQRYPAYFFVAFVINLFAILSAGLAPSLTENIDRIRFIVIGTVIAAFFQIFCCPHFIRDELHALIMASFRHLKRLNEEIFSCFHPEYPDNIYLFERRIHNGKNRFMLTMARLQEIEVNMSIRAKITFPDFSLLSLLRRYKNVKSEKVIFAQNRIAERRKRLAGILIRLDHLYDTILDCGQLRRRVTDHTIFSLCNDEMAAISQEINKLFLELSIRAKITFPDFSFLSLLRRYKNVKSGKIISAQSLISIFTHKKNNIDTNLLTKKIKCLEENYQHVLQVTSNEPLVFFLFISSLKTLRDQISGMRFWSSERLK